MKNDNDFVKCKRSDGKVWKGSHMDIYAKPGTVVVYHGTFTAQVNWGTCSDPRPLLGLEKVYTVKRMEVHGSWTGVELEEVPCYLFPAGAFHEVGQDGDWVEETEKDKS